MTPESFIKLFRKLCRLSEGNCECFIKYLLTLITLSPSLRSKIIRKIFKILKIMICRFYLHVNDQKQVCITVAGF